MSGVGAAEIADRPGRAEAVTTLRGTFALLRADLDRAVGEYAQPAAAPPVRGWRRLAHLALPSMICAILFRLAHWCHAHGLRLAAGLLALLNRRLTGAQIHPASEIGPGLFVPHPAAVTLCCRAGRNLRTLPLAAAVPLVVPGWRGELPADTPELGHDVTLGAFALVLGGVRVGDAALVGVHAAVTTDLRPATVAVVPRHWTMQPSEILPEVPMSVSLQAQAGPRPPAEPGLRALAAADRAALEAHLGRRVGWWHAGRMALRLQRLGHATLRRGWKWPARLIWASNLMLTGADLENAAVFGPGCVMAEPRGIIIYGDLGAGCVLGARVGVGGLLRGLPKEPSLRGPRPDVGADCVLGADSMVLGTIDVGARCRIGPGCMVMSDLPADTVIVARPGAWRTMRVDMYRRPRPPLPEQPRLLATLRSDVARMVNENATSEPPTGGLPFWGHLILPALQATLLFRLAQALHRRGWRHPAAWLTRAIDAVYGLRIHPASEIGPAMLVPHAVGVHFCGRAGPLLALYPHSHTGPETWPALTADLPDAVPVLGRDVGVGASARVTGAVTLGDGAMIGVAATVTRDIAAGLSVVPRPNWVQVGEPAAATVDP